MKSKSLAFRTLLALSLATFGASLASATTYSGNGGNGFGGTVGNATLSITGSSSMLSFVLNAGAAFGSNDNLVLYIDSVAGGFSDTSTLSDTSDGGHVSVSGEDNGTRTVATFASGFTADYALVLDPTDSFAGLFQLGTNGTAGTVTYVTVPGGTNYSNPATNVYGFNLPPSIIGLTGTNNSFAFEGSLISQTAFRSNETFGTSTVTPPNGGTAPNAGFTGPENFSTANTFTVVPEPSCFLLLGSAGALWWMKKRRRG